MRRNIYHVVALLALFLLSSVVANAQMSDQQVIQELRKYENSGMSQQQIMLELSKKGITMTQLSRIKRAYEEQQNADTGLESNYDPSENTFRDTEEVATITEETVQTKREDLVFGQNFFSSGNMTFAPNMNMPTPTNYVLGPGDQLLIDVWGNSELNVRYTITPDGFITVPGIGRISLSGLSIKQAEAKIRNEFSSIYSDLDSPTPGTFLGISVGNVRTIKVNVMGEVMKPGTYTLTSFASAFHALYVSGGPNKIGSLRNIHIFRGRKSVATVDLYDYLMNGNNSGDITLRDGDIVKVEPYGILVQAIGEVKRPMWYEMREYETLADLIKYAGGFSGQAFEAVATVQRKGEDRMEVVTLNKSEYASFRMQDGDQVEIGNILDKYSNMVEITGAVNRPGKYAVGDRIKTVKDLIDIAQGTTGDAYLQRVLLYRQQEDLRQTMEAFDLNDLLTNRINDIALKENDRLHVPSIFSIEDSVSVFVGGEVRAPGRYPFATNMRLEDAILRAGGLTEAASTARIDVFRRTKDASALTQRNTIGESFTFTLQNGAIVSNNPDFVLQPYDQVVIRRSPGYEVQEGVFIEGEVLFGGRYAKLEKGERISSLVKRAGGITDNGYIKGAKLLRKQTKEEIERSKSALLAKATEQNDLTIINNLDLSSQYIGIDLAKALKKPGSDDDLVLREGDVLSIPEFTNTVKISGGVLYPNTVTYKRNMKLGGYIRQAGGYSRLAMKNKPYVIYMNGKVASGRWAKIEPGCEIVVPERPEREPMSLQSLLSISTSVATLGLLISNFVK